MSKGKYFQDENTAPPLTGAQALFGLVRVPGGTRPTPRPPRPFVPAKSDHYPGYSAERLAEMTGTHITSARRWKRSGAPEPVAKLLRILIAGDLGEIDPAWTDWKLKGGKLHGPADWSFRPGEVLSIPFRQAQVASLERSKTYELQADFVDGTWNTPDERKLPELPPPTEPPVQPNRRKAAVVRRLRNDGDTD